MPFKKSVLSTSGPSEFARASQVSSLPPWLPHWRLDNLFTSCSAKDYRAEVSAPHWTPADPILMWSGARLFAFDSVGDIRGTDGKQHVILKADAEVVSLQGGADYLRAQSLSKAHLGKGNDIAVIDGAATFVSLGHGHDRLTAHGQIETVKAGAGADRVHLQDSAQMVHLGSGDDLVTTRGTIEKLVAGDGGDTIVFKTADAFLAGRPAADVPVRIDGGTGHDKIRLANDLGDFDIAALDDGLVLIDRFTGAEAEIRDVEWFVFNGTGYALEDLTEQFSSDTPNVLVSAGTQNVSVVDPDPGVSVVWNRAAIQSVIDTELPSGPTIASRVYAMVHTAIFDAWAAFDDTAQRIAEDAEGDNAALRAEIESAGLLGDPLLQAEAMSVAAYTVLRDLFPAQKALHDSVLEGRYGLDPENLTGLAAQVGLDAAADLIAQRAGDGANQAGLYADTTGYAPVNAGPLAVTDITRWTPENVPIDPEGPVPDQSFLTPHWGLVDGFALVQSGPPATEADTQLAMALADPDITSLYPNQSPAPEPFFTESFAGSTLDLAAGQVTLDADSSFGTAGETIPVTPALIGEIINPDFIAQAEVVLDYSRGLGLAGGDAGKVSAEFYEDGPGTGFPPGTSMVFAEFLSADRDHTLDEDAFLFLVVSNAVFDAGIATWEAKTFYDYVRPVRAIRDLGELGLIGAPGIDYKGEAGQVVEAYIPAIGEIGMVLTGEWITYQTPGGDPSPPFAEYTSGHSAFSAAGAAALRAFTGSDTFGASVTFKAGDTLFEPGMTPAEDLTITWDTFSEAADEAGLSRLYGGIHFEQGDFHGRALGEHVGQNAYDLALAYLEGTIA